MSYILPGLQKPSYSKLIQHENVQCENTWASKISKSIPWQIEENTESLFEKWHCSQLFWFSVSRNTDNKETVKLLYSRQQYKFLVVVFRGSRCKKHWQIPRVSRIRARNAFIFICAWLRRIYWVLGKVHFASGLLFQSIPKIFCGF